MSNVLAVLGIIALIVLAIVLLPFALVWAVNTLFLTAIPYTFKTWLAALILGALPATRISKNS